MNAVLRARLEELSLPELLPGDACPDPVAPMHCLTPAGVEIPGGLTVQFEVVELYRMEPDSVVQDVVGHRTVSTVYLGLNHGWAGIPLIWETMIFPDGDYAWRYATRAAAMNGHRTVLGILREMRSS